ncbi:hypothetical protein [Sneathiella limimaris]|uniref:hypothetical protein n=1 Tax=Sneathiella limimaris TaxID=1964213 RepID=UPI00146F89CB|nr:hypothetical protein [Sneathiella limimaris]
MKRYIWYVGELDMRHKAVVGVTQLLALLIGIGISFGIAAVLDVKGCVAGGYGFCFLDTVIVTAMASVAFVAFAFAALLCKAYSQE